MQNNLVWRISLYFIWVNQYQRVLDLVKLEELGNYGQVLFDVFRLVMVIVEDVVMWMILQEERFFVFKMDLFKRLINFYCSKVCLIEFRDINFEVSFL